MTRLPRGTRMRSLWNALLRQCRRWPAATGVAVCTLALGIGASVAIFSVLNAVLFRPLPYPESERLVRVWGSALERGIDRTSPSYPKFELARAETEVFESVGAAAFGPYTLTGRGEPEQVPALRVSASLLDVLGLKPALGRGFTAEEDLPGGPCVVMLAHDYWRTRFASDAGIVGQSLTLDGVPCSVVGVLSERLTPPFDQTRLWAPRAFDIPGLAPAQREGGAGYLELTARLRPGVTIEQANRVLEAVATRYRESHGSNIDARFGLAAESYREALLGPQRPALYALAGAVALVLLIACANVASILLARSIERVREQATRVALGAGRRRLVLDALHESLALSLLAAVLGTGLAALVLRVLSRSAAAFLPRAGEIGIDGVALACALALAALTTLVVGLVPGLQLSRIAPSAALADGARGSSGGRGLRRLGRALIAGEIALSLTLLVLGALLASSFLKLLRDDPGFRTDGLFVATVTLPEVRYDSKAKQGRFYADLHERLAHLPGVSRAGVAVGLPLTGADFRTTYAVEGRPLEEPSKRPLSLRRAVTPGYFATLGIPLRQGRDFTAEDTADRPLVVVIGESLALRLFPGGDAVGHRLVTGMAAVPREIVGVVGATRSTDLAQAPRDEMYLPLAQAPDNFAGIALETRLDPQTLAGSVRAALRGIDPELPLADVGSLDGVLAATLGGRRFVMQLLGAFALVALVLATVGIYGVMAYGVARRSGEIGVRLALGAQGGQVRRMVLSEGARTVALGLAGGAVLAFGAARLAQGLLYGVGTADPLSYLSMALVVAGVAFAACWVPALRATRVDPASVLRSAR